MKPHADITDPSVGKALAHPLRVRIMGVLDEGDASPSEIAEELGVPLGNVSYHVRQLARLGLIKLVRRVPRRGAVEHYYRAESRPRITDAAWGSTPEIVKQAMLGATLDQLGAQVNAAASTGGFSRTEAHLSRLPVTLDQAGWRALSQELAAMISRVERIEAASRKRLERPSSDDPGLEATLVMMLFEREPEAARQLNPRRAARPRRASDGRTPGRQRRSVERAGG